MNLLNETIEDIESSGHTVSDIIFIGSEADGYCCEWEDFRVIANLVIVFSDGAKMWRHEYDGSEIWEYSTPFKMPENKKKLLKVTSGGMWQDLDEIHKAI
tara:strand:- start:10244 stop:10543 length:300 start_codon:yes stop_codon:yes gene_type:complete